MDTIGKVRRAYWVQGKTIKAICREQRLARDTVRRIVRSGQTAAIPVYERKEQPFPKLGLFLEQLDGLLAENASRPKRDRVTMKRIHEQLRDAGYAGSYDAVRRYARLAPTACLLDGGGVHSVEFFPSCRRHAFSMTRGVPVRLEPRGCDS